MCQGLEVDYVGLCWGGDLIWKQNAWVPRQMRAPRWQGARKEEAKQCGLNAYRLLLAHAHAGLAICSMRQRYR
ncbi:DNA/RNA helicase domain-containing protein [Palleronia marisminoris]|uniref:DNA/RNA helicase domain-containing protein n=1 Tax=Palleronia marisminoris TaxID=315423 RepID=UPI003520FC24